MGLAWGKIMSYEKEIKGMGKEGVYEDKILGYPSYWDFAIYVLPDGEIHPALILEIKGKTLDLCVETYHGFMSEECIVSE